MNFWCVFTTAPGKERPAAQKLGQRGMLAHVPLVKRPIRAKGRRMPAEWRPVASGYVFVWLPLDGEAIGDVFRQEFMDGKPIVRDLLGGITEAAMREWLKAIDECRSVSSVKQLLKAGDAITVKNGALNGKTAVVTTVKGETLSVMVEMFNRPTLAVVRASDVELADTTQKDQEAREKSLHCGANQTTTIRRDVGRSATGGSLASSAEPRAKWAR